MPDQPGLLIRVGERTFRLSSFHGQNLDTRFAGILLGVALALFPGQGVASADESGDQVSGVFSVPAEFVYSLRLPGITDHIRRPSAIFVDHAHGEVLVGDAGFNRLLIFDHDGVYRYEFNFADQVGSVVDLAVDSSGFVYVLGTSREGLRVLRYDFDGVFLNEVKLDGVGPARIESMTIDGDDHLVLIDAEGICYVAETDGVVSHSFDAMIGISESAAQEVVRGKPRVYEGHLLLPASSLGTVFVFDLASGQALPSIGTPGNTPGQLQFPVAVDVTSAGLVVVLDKMRFNVQCYALSGRFLGEFGGKGYRDGWMYHPTLLSAVRDDQVVVGQGLDQRVQVLHIPDLVLERLSRELEKGSSDEALDLGMRTQMGLPESDPRTP